MPSILITPGTFNPPAAPVQSVGIITFPKKPDVTLTRRPQQSSRSRGFTPPLPPLPSNVISLQRSYFTGACVLGINSENDASPGFNLSRTRYVPDGSYTADTVNTYPGGTGYLFDVAPWGRTAESMDLGEVLMHGRLFVTVNYTVGIAGNTDGATYEVTVREGNFGAGIIGTSGAIDIFLGYTGDIDVETSIQFFLRRNGVICDTVIIGLRLVGTAVDDGSGLGGDTYTIAPDGLPEILYGGDAIAPVITGPSAPILTYTRISQVLQGALTLS